LKNFSIFLMVICALMIVIIPGCGKKKQSSAEIQASDSIPNLLAETDTAAQPATTEGKTLDTYFEPKQKTATPEAGEFSKNGRYVVQVSASQFEAASQKISDKLKADGVPSYMVSVDNPTPELSGTFYRVRIGSFATLTAATSFAETYLQTKGYTYWIDNKSNDNVASDVSSGISSETSSYAPAATTQPAATSTPPSSPASSWGNTEPSSSTPPSTSTGTSSSSWGETSTTSPSTTPSSSGSSTSSPATTSSTPTTPPPAPATPAAPPSSTPATNDWGSSSSGSTGSSSTSDW
jgi:hypothetical protein